MATSANFRVARKRARPFAIARDHPDQQGSMYPTIPFPDHAALTRSLGHLTETQLRPPRTYLRHLALPYCLFTDAFWTNPKIDAHRLALRAECQTERMMFGGGAVEMIDGGPNPYYISLVKLLASVVVPEKTVSRETKPRTKQNGCRDRVNLANRGHGLHRSDRLSKRKITPSGVRRASRNSRRRRPANQETGPHTEFDGAIESPKMCVSEKVTLLGKLWQVEMDPVTNIVRKSSPMNRKKTRTGPDCNQWQPDRRLWFIRFENLTGCGSSKSGIWVNCHRAGWDRSQPVFTTTTTPVSTRTPTSLRPRIRHRADCSADADTNASGLNNNNRAKTDSDDHDYGHNIDNHDNLQQSTTTTTRRRPLQPQRRHVHNGGTSTAAPLTTTQAPPRRPQ
ncbi:hypothetical protein EDB85DRAFT_1902858 [Lactarius pseudohatsudake]|nr:hypothetical protein EDB85DRAFT_1902858 [Lactarius pseudohatsudake]